MLIIIGGVFVSQINEMELQSLRALIGAHQTGSKKLDAYAGSCQDAQLKQVFQTESQKCAQKSQQLMGFLSQQ